MSKYFQRGNFCNKYVVSVYKNFAISTSGLSTVKNSNVTHELQKNQGMSSMYSRTLIIRGIGYRAFLVANDAGCPRARNYSFLKSLRPLHTEDIESELVSLNYMSNFDLQNPRYLLLRAGHTVDMHLPLHTASHISTSKKDRKLVVADESRSISSEISKQAWAYRKPSVYTGRGIRFKQVKPLRKAGKKDKQKGKAF